LLPGARFAPLREVKANVALAPGADDNPLATWLAERVVDNVQRSERVQREFYRLRAAVVLVAPDRRLQVTLRFDHGHLTIHDGMIGVPDVTFCADLPILEALTRLGKGAGSVMPRLGKGRLGAWRAALAELIGGELKIYGLLNHPRLVLRVLRVLSAAE
jgi:hypothetical protein